MVLKDLKKNLFFYMQINSFVNVDKKVFAQYRYLRR